MHVLILGGTTEASALARALAEEYDVRATLSLAGRTRSPAPPPIPTRIGGFGGIEGLCAYLRAEGVDVLIDATHPFAAQMSRHAGEAAALAGIECLAVVRPPWRAQEGDRWTEVSDMAEAAATLGPAPRRVFLTVGQQELAPFRAAPQHRYLIRSVEPIADPPAGARCFTARGPFAEPDERALMRNEGVEVLVTKNSGGSATAAKLGAARGLGVAVTMIARPPPPDGPSVPDADAAFAWLRRHARERRGA